MKLDDVLWFTPIIIAMVLLCGWFGLYENVDGSNKQINNITILNKNIDRGNTYLETLNGTFKCHDKQLFSSFYNW